jgi:gamma-glutamylcysteine synthetase
MNKAEIRKKFDEIVAFAEVEKFIDTPVKRYSSIEIRKAGKRPQIWTPPRFHDFIF